MIRPRMLVAALLVAALAGSSVQARQATISEGLRSLRTYPYSEPDAIPILTRDARLYPYYGFEGYAHEAVDRDWNVVTLENDFIQVFVLPEAGGKVWGAIEKATGKEFIYRNEVMKFRNIALRGPWTSGGIEFNFGVIGHTPSTASPVNYELVENQDGSVSCWVGSTDLPSHTRWRVEIRLPADASYFETNVTFSNPTVLEQPYYNWMTAAAFARDDLEMAIPGNQYLKHSGEALPWPVDAEGRDLSVYDNNRFESHKSYHVVGEVNDFFGGYYRNEDWGFGHWARYEDMPGQKLWLWSLARDGGVWEELLTDTDGQYVEYQAGRMFVQYSAGEHQNPITEGAFPPLATDTWSERWYPVMGTGGLSEVSQSGLMHVGQSTDGLSVRVNTFRAADLTMQAYLDGESIFSGATSLAPLTVWTETVPRADRIVIPELDLEWKAERTDRTLQRPFALDPDARPSQSQAQRDLFEGRERMKARRYDAARALFEGVESGEPWNRDALVELAELDLRAGLFEAGLHRVNKARELDAHDARANFLAGALYQATGRHADARDAFAWAARSTTYRSAANVRLAEIALQEGRLDEAEEFARRALLFDGRSAEAVSLLATLQRVRDGGGHFSRVRLHDIDPLSEALAAEYFLLGEESMDDVLRSEFPDQVILDLVVRYDRIGRREDAVRLLKDRLTDTSDPMIALWLGFLADDPAMIDRARDLNRGIGRPYRVESLPVLAWAVEHADDWMWPYLQGLNLWALGRTQEALATWQPLGNRPDHAAFYVARSHLTLALDGPDALEDLVRAVEQRDAERITHLHLIRALQQRSAWHRAMARTTSAMARWPEDFNLQLLQARNRMMLNDADEAVAIMEDVQVLPSEGGREAHVLFESAHLLAAMARFNAGDLEASANHVAQSREWPERLGQGRPYVTDERIADYLSYRLAWASQDVETAARIARTLLDAPTASTDPVHWLIEDVRRRQESAGIVESKDLPDGGADLISLLVRQALTLDESR